MTILDGREELVSRNGREWRDHHANFRRLAELTGEWAGIPLPVEGFDVRLEDRHSHRDSFERILNERNHRPADGATLNRTCGSRDLFHIVNGWWSARRHCWVWLVCEDGEPPRYRAVLDRADRTAGRRLTFALGTIGVSQVWDLAAEMRAREKLRSMITPHAYESYELTGSFLWSSARSRVTYLFRRCRPTVAIVPARRDLGEESSMKILAVLCLHPLGYYADTWAGAMVPTDDVIAHYTWATADEHGYWRRANQHYSQTAEAGL